MQHDVQELNRVLSEKLEDKMKICNLMLKAVGMFMRPLTCGGRAVLRVITSTMVKNMACRSANICMQIFLNMAVLVDSQGDMLDNIETHVCNAVDHVQSGNRALLKAKSLRRNTKK